MYHRIGNSALETTGISAESYELAKDAAVTAAGATALGKLAKVSLGIGKKLTSGSSLSKSLNSTNNKTNNTNDNGQQNESTHNNSLNLNSISDVNQAIEQTRSSKDNYTKKLEKNKQITLNKHL